MLDKLSILSPNTKYCSLRISRLFGLGDGMKWDEVPHKFIKKIHQDKKIILHGGNQTYDLINVKDVARAIIKLISKNLEKWPSVLNISSGKPINLKNYLNIVKKNAIRINKKKPSIKILKSTKNYFKQGLNNKLAIKTLKWKPFYSINDSVIEIFNHLKRKKIL